MTVETVKYVQAIFIEWDVDLVCSQNGTQATVQQSSLNEELGQVSYVLSDKTGTLTCNHMSFKKVSIGGVSYGSSFDECSDSTTKEVTNFNMVDTSLDRVLSQKVNQNNEYANCSAFLTHLAICHTIVSSKDPKDETKIVLNSSSPDELALINGAKYYGVKFVERTSSNQIIIRDRNEGGRLKQYQLLNVIEFTSDRKRMTVIVRTPQDQIKVLCKGADSALIPLLAMSSENLRVKEKTMGHLYDYAKDGLRTLMICEKTLDHSFYRNWQRTYENAKFSINNKDQKVRAAVAEIENNFNLLGATAIEDELQEEVGETISSIKQAGIKFWMLTGDKMETAINIGFSCKVLDQESELF